MSTVIGPVIDRLCGWCDGTGRDVSPEGDDRSCGACDGTGRISMEVKPFVTLTACMENLQSVRTCMGLRRTESFKPKVGTPAYHLDAAEDYLGSLFQQLAVMLPEEHDRTEGE